MSQITELLIRHEGMRLKPYRDTVGKLTIGVGRNLDDVGITADEADYLLGHDIAVVASGLRRSYAWFSSLNDVRQDALIDMAFNLGLGTFAKFEHMLNALIIQDWNTAADEMLASNWAREVGARATELAAMVRTGLYQQ